jgi:hypothetical protein
MKRDLEAAERATQKAVMQEKVLDEGDYFGVRAIEKGFYGGIAQSASTSAANSPRLSPVLTMIDGNGPPISPTSLRGSGIPELLLSGSKASLGSSNVKLMRTHAPTMTLRLQPSDAELGGRKNHDPAVTMSTYVPTPPKSRSRLETSMKSTQNSESIPRISALPSLRPTLNRQVRSYAQWRLSADMRSTARVVSRSENKASCLRSPEASVINTYTNPQTGRSKSRSVSSEEERNQLPSLERELDARKAESSIDFLTQSSPFASDSSNDSTQQSSRRRSHSQDAVCDHNQYSSSSSISGSSIQSRSSSDATSASSIKSMTESLEDIREATPKDGCNHCRQKSEGAGERTHSAAIQPVATLSVSQ